MKNKDNGKSQKTFLGMPMNWEPKMIFKTVWNKDDDRLFPPKSFGIGWTVNFHAVCKKIGVVSPETKSKK